MVPYINKIQFFKDLKLSDASYIDMLLKMDLVVKDPEQEVCRFGDVGDLFYLILEGVVEI